MLPIATYPAIQREKFSREWYRLFQGDEKPALIFPIPRFFARVRGPVATSEAVCYVRSDWADVMVPDR